ncbi:MAG: dinitrogenase iron-molybdenum cofactor biosynthesis protein [Colwellia sp.]
MTPVLDEQLALRLGLAAKAVPTIALKNFIKQLISQLGEPLSEKKLRSLSPKSLYQSLIQQNRDIDRGQSNQALAILTNKTIASMEAPEVEDKALLTGPKIRVAITSNNDEMIDGHFGSCLRFLIYEVNDKTWQLVEVRPVCCSENGLARTDYLVTLLHDCHVLATLSIGGPAAAKVVRANIHPIKRPLPQPSKEVLSPLQQVISNTPAPWLQKILDEQEN